METFTHQLFAPCISVVTTDSGTTTDVSSNTTLLRSALPGISFEGNYKDPNPWSYRVKRQLSFQGEVRYFAPGISEQRRGCGIFIASPGAPPDLTELGPHRDAVYNEALSRVNEKVRGTLDLSVALGEAGKTAKMLNVISRLREAVRNLRSPSRIFVSKRGKTRYEKAGWASPGWQNLTKMPASAWLEYNYGWRPLISDLYGAADESLRLVINRIQSVTGRCTKREVVDYPGSVAALATYSNVEISSALQGEVTQRMAIHLTFRNDDIDLARWTSLNPASIAWELTPYSFVVDWFVDIGSFLRNVETAIIYRNRFVSGYYSDLRISRCQAGWEGQVSPSPNVVFEYNIGGGMTEVIHFERKLYTGYPLPTVPRFNADLSSRRLLSLASLLAQRLRKP